MDIKGTTVISVRKGSKVAIASDGQVTFGQATIIKNNAQKVRKLEKFNILIGFAGATADAFTLLELFEAQLQSYKGNIKRASIELAKKWRTDKMLRRLEAMIAVADKESSLIISGTGDVIEPADGILAIGSGGMYARSAAIALLKHSDLEVKDIVKESLLIAASICVYTNDQISIEEL